MTDVQEWGGTAVAAGYGILHHTEEETTETDAPEVEALQVSDLAEDQLEVYNKMVEWVQTAWMDSVLTVGGYAGTGKSTLISILARELGQECVAFVTYTGKASSVLGRKLRRQGLRPHTCGTIHSFLYIPVTDPKTGKVVDWRVRPSKDFDDYTLIIVDEASMVGRAVWEDLRSIGIPILAVGDHGQLPPVGGDNLSLIQDPDLRLEKIHRQAEGNPIIALSKSVREEGRLVPPELPGRQVTFIRHSEQLSGYIRDLLHNGCAVNDFVVICRYNRTRIRINRTIRALLGLSGPPAEGDPVICLKNQRFPGGFLSNGMRGIWTGECKETQDFYGGRIRFPDEHLVVHGRFNKHQFNCSPTFSQYEDARKAGHMARIRGWADLGLLFDFAGCLSCHKSQGSQWKNVLVIEETPPRRCPPDDHRRWLYTAVTRAEENLYVLPRSYR